MPELPEVETIRLDLRPPVVGRTVVGAWVSASTPRLVQHLPLDEFCRALVGRTIEDVTGRAEEGGVKRPPAMTPLEFAPPLMEHFRPLVPGEVSSAFARGRYGLKGVPPGEMDRLLKRWKEVGRQR